MDYALIMSIALKKMMMRLVKDVINLKMNIMDNVWIKFLVVLKLIMIQIV